MSVTAFYTHKYSCDKILITDDPPPKMFFNYRLYQDDFLVAMLSLACFCFDLSNHIKSYMT